MLTLKEFQKGRKKLSPAKAGELLGTDFSSEVSEVHTYEDELWIFRDEDGAYRLHIAGSEFEGTRAAMEAELYFGWYVWECVNTHTLNDLSTLMADWCAWKRIEHASADEMFAQACSAAPEDRTPEDRERISWLGYFMEAWEAATERAGEAA